MFSFSLLLASAAALPTHKRKQFKLSGKRTSLLGRLRCLAARSIFLFPCSSSSSSEKSLHRPTFQREIEMRCRAHSHLIIESNLPELALNQKDVRCHNSPSHLITVWTGDEARSLFWERKFLKFFIASMMLFYILPVL